MQNTKSLPSLFAQLLFFKEGLWANLSGHSEQKSDGRDSLLFTRESLTTNEQIAWKTDEQIPNPDSKS